QPEATSWPRPGEAAGFPLCGASEAATGRSVRPCGTRYQFVLHSWSSFWREAAENVALSLKKGDPVVVTGRIFSRQYIKDEANHVAYEVEPEAVGHDLTRGTSVFTKRRRGFSGSVELDADNMPIHLSDQGYEVVGDEAGLPAGDDVEPTRLDRAG
ncbi:MAG TPA: single-stranded DNA-binding protein, partial [Jatrophihabitans sp.]|nr:single-stranded DNA-binding protein [Jatrophihabitans sp.]